MEPGEKMSGRNACIIAGGETAGGRSHKPPFPLTKGVKGLLCGEFVQGLLSAGIKKI
jgi:hypothetical protein